MNNRQAGRRRGRGGQRSQGNPGRGPDSGNRIDNRARGNAAQLLEKYKNLARDAQMQGDRVNTEYYLQFADHYFRVLNESRARFEENRRQRGEGESEDEEFEFEGEGAEERSEQRHEGRGERQRDRRPREEQGEARNGHGNGANGRPVAQNDAGQAAIAAPASETGLSPEAPVEERPVRRRGRPRKAEAEVPATIEADRLPPAMGLEGESGTPDEVKPRRRRRARADDEAIPPAA